MLSMDDLDHEGLLSTRNLRRAAILAATLLVAVGGFGAGRTTAPHAAALAAPNAIAPALPDWPGATRLESGAPVGYTHTPVGAVDAATNYQILLAGPLLTTPTKLREAEQVIYTPAARDSLMAGAEQGLVGLNTQTQLLTNATKGVPVSLICVPITYRIDSYDPAHAAVSVWWVWVVGQQGAMVPTQAWVTSFFSLEWQGDWKVADVSSVNALVPLLTQSPIQTRDLPAQMNGYQEYTHVGRQ